MALFLRYYADLSYTEIADVLDIRTGTVSATLNAAIGALRGLVVHGQPALRNLVAPDTNFGGFWRALEDFSATLAPVAEQQASTFAALDRTFAAFANVARPFIQETISKSPETLDAANADLPVLRPFLRDSGRFFTALRPGAKALAETSPTIAAALHAGVPSLNRSPALNSQLAPTAQALVDFQEAPGVFTGLDLLIDTNNILDPALRFIAPAQTVCNYGSLAFRNLSNSETEGNGFGHWIVFIALNPPEGPNSEGSPASAPANGGGPNEKNHLHYNTYPNTAAPGQPHECEAGNETYEKGKTVIGNLPSLEPTQTAGQLPGQGDEK
jgi:ABC-type transporter Mla subunit MlaD